jgi:hypothetical protein
MIQNAQELKARRYLGFFPILNISNEEMNFGTGRKEGRRIPSPFSSQATLTSNVSEILHPATKGELDSLAPQALVLVAMGT